MQSAEPFYDNCPNCGAPIDPQSEKCEYCGTYHCHKVEIKYESFSDIITAEPLTQNRYDI